MTEELDVLQKYALTQLKMAVPPAPILENALGYEGEARWWAMYWEPAGDEAMVTDGQVTKTGEWDAYLDFYHSNLRALLAYSMGDSDNVAKHWMVIDRLERKAYAAPYRMARAFLAEQWPKSDGQQVVHLTEAQWEELLKEIQKELKMSSAEQLMTAWEKHQKALSELRVWLNSRN